MVCGLGRLFKVVYLDFEIFKMLLLSFSECSLGGPILRFTFLLAKSDPSHGGQVIHAHRRGLRCQRLASWFLARLVLTFSPLATSFVAIFAINALPFIVQLAGSLGEIANHLALAVEVKRVISFTIDVKIEIWTVIGTEVKVP